MRSHFLHPCQISIIQTGGRGVYMKEQRHSFRPPTRWNENIDRIVKEAFQAAYDELHPRKRLTIATYPNDRMRGFATTFEISSSRFENFQRPLRLSSMEYLRKVGVDGGGELVRKLMQIPGVTEVSIRPYEATVEIAKAFSWTELDDHGESIEDKIVDAFKAVFGNLVVSRK